MDFWKAIAEVKKLNTATLLLYIFVPTLLLSGVYLLAGNLFQLPNLLLFCMIGTFTLVPIELGIVCKASKEETGKYSLRSAFVGQQRLKVWKIILIAAVFFGIAGLLSITVAPLENHLFAGIRKAVLDRLPTSFDWTDHGYLRSFSKTTLRITCLYYCIFNVLIAPITEELFFRGYLTSHYETQNPFTPIFLAILFSLYHFWLPFNNIFRILAFAPVAYVAYKKRNIYISIVFHCLCNLFSSIGFCFTVLQYIQL